VGCARVHGNRSARVVARGAAGVRAFARWASADLVASQPRLPVAVHRAGMFGRWSSPADEPSGGSAGWLAHFSKRLMQRLDASDDALYRRKSGPSRHRVRSFCAHALSADDFFAGWCMPLCRLSHPAHTNRRASRRQRPLERAFRPSPVLQVDTFAAQRHEDGQT
jgi:hypothetical protein